MLVTAAMESSVSSECAELLELFGERLSEDDLSDSSDEPITDID